MKKIKKKKKIKKQKKTKTILVNQTTIMVHNVINGNKNLINKIRQISHKRT